MSRYEPSKIEAKWRDRWAESNIYEVDVKAAERPFYNLMMFPIEPRVVATREEHMGDWHALEVELSGGDEVAALALRSLLDSGVEISRFEKVETTLATLIERLMEAADGQLDV